MKRREFIKTLLTIPVVAFFVGSRPETKAFSLVKWWPQYVDLSKPENVKGIVDGTLPPIKYTSIKEIMTGYHGGAGGDFTINEESNHG